MTTSSELITTFFASAKRSSAEEITRQQAILQAYPGLPVLLAAPGLIFVLNADRQIVLAAKGAAEALGLVPDRAVGMRPGEAIGCVHADKEDGGCGTTEFCAECGAVNAILSGLKGVPTVEECRVMRRVDEKIEALDLRVTATPASIGGETFTIFAIQDASHEKRRQALERIFFHDVLNAVGGLKGLMSFLVREAREEPGQLAKAAFDDFGLLLDLIKGQRDYMSAERGDLRVNLTAVPPGGMLQIMAMHFGARPVGAGKRIEIDNRCEDVVMTTDYDLLRRALEVMTQNALEAEEAWTCVTLRCEATRCVFESAPDHGDAAMAANGAEGEALPAVRFSVHNPTPMPEELRPQVFRRAFTTKGAGRGLGLFYLRLLGERYLGGRLDFASDPDQGTTFSLTLPLGPVSPH